jgi:hypothetical protein
MSKDLFEANPSLDRYYETADGTAFYTNNSAELHAKTLDDKSVVLRKRNESHNPEGELESHNPEGELESPKPEGELESHNPEGELEAVETPKAKKNTKTQ